jgi:ATP-dependent RNA helicase DDX23/PRP28
LLANVRSLTPACPPASPPSRPQCDSVARQLTNLDYRVTMLHGGKSQDQREESIKGFREDVYNVLVATDVAGRGIDVPGVALVINYDMANTVEAYTHRIGRTGRAGRKGTAVTFLTLKDSGGAAAGSVLRKGSGAAR